MMAKRFGSACKMVLALGSITLVTTAARAEDPVAPFPITDPSYEPEYWGVGHEPGVQAALNSPTVLFVNMDGATMNGGCGNDSHNNCTTIGFLSGRTIAPFAPDDPARRNAVIQATREDVEDFGVIVVGERPPDSNPYAMVMVGTPEGVDVGSIGGIAPGIDCGNSNPNITSFSFLQGNSNIIATVIHQEAAHTWGLEHIDDSTDNLYPTAGGTTNPKYNDSCSQIVSDTDLNPTSGQCNQIHTMFCNSGQQNSYQEMLALFGPPVPDNISPTVIIENPTEGQVLDYEEDFELVITLDDDRKPQIIDTIIYFDGVEAAATPLLDSTHAFPVAGGDAPQGHGLGNGSHTIRVEGVDEWGNPASDEVTFTIQNAPGGVGDDESGSGDDGSSGSDGGEEGGTGGSDASGSGTTADVDNGEGGCSCRNTTPGGTTAGLLLLIGLVAHRRRHA